MRLNFIYTLAGHFHQFQQIIHAGDRPPLSLSNEWIRGSRIGPGSRQIGRVPLFGEVINAPLSPATPQIDQLKAPTAPRMEGVGDREELCY